MNTALDDIRNADATMLREVWQWGGYEPRFGPYPGRSRALLIIEARDVAESAESPGTDEVPALRISPQEFINAVVHILSVAWALAFVAAGYVPDQPRREVPASAPRACRFARKHPFRSAVRCTAPPSRWARSAGQQDP